MLLSSTSLQFDEIELPVLDSKTSEAPQTRDSI
jgi:hypothetical protein